MDYKRFFLKLQEKSLPACLLFDGEEEYVKQSALAQLKKSLLPEGLDALNETVFADRAPVDGIVEACETLPFMAEKRLVIVKDHPLFLPSGKSAEGEAELFAYLDRLPSHAVLVFYLKGNADMRKKLPKRVAALGGDVRFGYLSEGELASWVRRQLRAYQKTMEPAALEELLFRAGPMVSRVEAELRKLADFLGERGGATLEDVRLVVTPSAENTVFQLIDALLQGRAEEALSIHRQLKERGESGFGVLALFTSQVRRMLHMRAVLDGGKNRQEAARALGLSSFVAARVYESVQKQPTDKLRAMLLKSVEADYSIKSGQIKEEEAISLLFLSVLGSC